MAISKKDIRKVQRHLEMLIKMRTQVEKSLESAPSGTLKVVMSRKRYVQYYLRDEKNPEKKCEYQYLSKEEMPLISRLAQKEYDEKMLKEIDREITGCKAFLRNIKANRLETRYETLSVQKRNLIRPYIQTEEEYIQQWYAMHPQNQNSIQIQKGVKTDRGEWVRSKSEKIIADALYHHNIPYVYEAPLKLPTGHTIFPDFTILNVAERKTLYLEHLGMMGDPEYSSRSVKKLSTYNAAGICLGDRLLITMETEEVPLDVSILEDLIQHHLIGESGNNSH